MAFANDGGDSEAGPLFTWSVPLFTASPFMRGQPGDDRSWKISLRNSIIETLDGDDKTFRER